MQSLDLRSIVLLAGFMGAMMSLVLVFLLRSYPASVRGLREWTAGAVTGTLAAILMSARGILPDWLTLVVGNLVLISGVSLFSMGTRRFLGMDSGFRVFAGIVVVMFLPLAWFSFIEPNYAMRLQLACTVLAAIIGEHAWLMHRRGGGSFAVRFTTIILGLQTIILALRAGSTGTLGENADLFSQSPMQTIYMASYAVTMLALSIGVILLATERLRNDLEYLATHDMMTGTLNRRAIVEAAERELARCRRHGHVMSLLMMDLDHFKKINDTYGHLVGDQVLREFAGKVSALLRLPDQFGRYGGEEFLLILPDTGRDAAAVVAERICKAAAESTAPAYTVSVGLATATLVDTGIDSLLSRADEALYLAKSGGRNQVVVAPLLQEVPSPASATSNRSGLRPVA
jgi:diguanylate cyclase (GGDEF)-like protein